MKRIPEALTSVPAIMKAFELLDIEKWTPEEVEAYEEWQRIEAERKYACEAVKQVGIQQGKLAAAQEIARKLVESGVERNIISQTTGLSQAEIARLCA